MAFPLVGGVLCLDFLNTVADGRELLTDFASFVRWLAEAGLLTAKEVGLVQQHWGGGRRSANALAGVKTLRETLRTAVDRFARGQAVPAATLAALNQQLAGAGTPTELVAGADGRIHKRFRLRWQEKDDLLAPVVASAADLLTGADPALLHQCAGAGCTLFFYDRTKNHRRRWCSVATCGNRAKVAAFRARQNQQGERTRR